MHILQQLRSITSKELIIAFSFILSIVMIEASGLKFVVADFIFNLEGNQWLLREHFITTNVMHSGTRLINNLALLSVLTLTSITVLKKSPNARRYILLVTSLVLSFAAINYLKAMLGMHCPWDINLYGGNYIYQPFWSVTEANGRCFPAGHASIGFAWVSLFYFWRDSNYSKAKLALALSIATGIILGIGQQLRGAHFFVDDLVTAGICLLIAHIVYRLGAKHV